METQTNELITFQNVQLTRTNLIIPEETSFNDWEEIGLKLKGVEGAVQFWIGDWINFGERKYGDKYLIAMAKTGFSYDYLQDISRISKKFDGSNSGTGTGINVATRHENLPFTHHFVVSGLAGPVAERLLNKAEKEHLSKRELEVEVREWHAEHDQKKPTIVPEPVFSWAKDENNLAGFDGLEDANQAFNKLFSDKRDRDMAKYFAVSLIAKTENYLKEWKKKLEVWR